MLRATNILIFASFALSLSALAEPARHRFTVTTIIDGDTIGVDDDGHFQLVRFIGIDTPESRVNDKAIRDAKRTNKSLKTITILGQEASNHLKTILHKGDTVLLEFDVEKTDRFKKRWYAYVYNTDGIFLNEKMAKDGFAVSMTVPPNVRYRDIFSTAVADARLHERGLWSEGLQ